MPHPIRALASYWMILSMFRREGKHKLPGVQGTEKSKERHNDSARIMSRTTNFVSIAVRSRAPQIVRFFAVGRTEYLERQISTNKVPPTTVRLGMVVDDRKGLPLFC